MQLRNEDFLNSYPEIGNFQAEYSILSCLFKDCEGMFFLFEIKDLDAIRNQYGNVVKYIKQYYKSHEIRAFILSVDERIDYITVVKSSGLTTQIEQLYNIAMERSKKNSSFVLVCAGTSNVLFHEGIFDECYKNVYSDKQRFLQAETLKYNIDDLEKVFELFHVERKYIDCDYIVNGKVSDSITEQKLRNHLMDYLKEKTNMMVIPELCTSNKEDEESVDISVINKNKEVSIIEVKYFVKRGLFENPDKQAYSFARFTDGYKQLNKYCLHLNQENYYLHSAFLYMFYAHSETVGEIVSRARERFNTFLRQSECNDYFKYNYKNTILDNMLDQKVSI